MKRNQWNRCNQLSVLVDGQNVPLADTTPVSGVLSTLDMDNVSFQLKTANVTRTITIDPADHVVASSHTWTFANGAFTAADVGGTLTVAGATNSNNNATVTISSVTNSTTIVTTGTQTNETFSNGTTTASVTDVPLAGAWTFQADNMYETDTGNNSIPNAGTWPDCTGLFTTVAAITTTSDKYAQCANFAGRAVRATFTPTSGHGTVSIIAFAKGTS
jgi:hypothetical protein